MQVSARLLDRIRVGFEHADKGVMGQILRLLAIAQAPGPGSDQLFIMFKETRSAGHFLSHRTGLHRWGANSNASY